MKKEAVLLIYYTDKQGKLHSETQGKFFYLDKKPVYLADMTPAKWWKNYGGYSIAKQLLNAFNGLKVQIIYRLQDKNILYYTTPSIFKKKGILVPYGGHEQYVLPIGHWKTREGNIDDPHNLPVMVLSDWQKSIKIDKEEEKSLFTEKEIWEKSRKRLKAIFEKRRIRPNLI